MREKHASTSVIRETTILHFITLLGIPTLTSRPLYDQQKEDNLAFSRLEAEREAYGISAPQRAPGFMYDRVLGPLAMASEEGRAKSSTKKNLDNRRVSKFTPCSANAVGYKANDMQWWEAKEHGSCSVTAEFYDTGHLSI